MEQIVYGDSSVQGLVAGLYAQLLDIAPDAFTPPTTYRVPLIKLAVSVPSEKLYNRHKHSEGEHYLFVCRPGRSDAETSTKPEIQEA